MFCKTSPNSCLLYTSESVATTYDFSNIASVSGKNTALESCLTSAYGFSVSNRSNINETFKLSSKNGADLNIYVSVSYTHLDVYKRQILSTLTTIF